MTDLIAAPAGTRSLRRSRVLVPAGIALLAIVVLIPNWIVLPPDDEGLNVEIASTAYQARQLFSGNWPLWDPTLAFGVPQPASETLIFHPFLVLTHVFSTATALGLFYQLQLLVGVFAVWAVARHIGLSRWIAGLCLLTYTLSSPTINYLRDFWPSIWFQWTFAPLLLLVVLKLLDAETRRARALYAIVVGACAAFFVLDGHPGLVVDFAIPFLAFLAAQPRRLRPLLPWLGLSLLIVLLACVGRAYDLLLESNRSSAPHAQQDLAFNWWRLFFYPIASGFQEHDYRYRTLAIGGPVAILILVGLFWRALRTGHVNGFRAGVVAAFVLWIIPIGWISTRSGNYYAADPLIIFGIFLAGLTLQELWARAREPWMRNGLIALVAVQAVALVAGFAPFYAYNARRAVEYLQGKPVLTLKNALKNQPIYRFFEARPDVHATRVYMAPGAEERLWRALDTTEWRKVGDRADYEFAAWSLHGLRLVNQRFRGADMTELTPEGTALDAQIKAEPTLAADKTALDALDIGYVLGTPADRVAPSLEKVATFELSDPPATIVAYRNRRAWPDAVVLDPRAKSIASLPLRDGCESPGLLCSRFDSVAALRRPGLVRGEHWDDTDLVVSLAPSAKPQVLMLSQLYRPGWKAELSNGKTVSGYRLLGGFTGFDLPPGTTSARIVFAPPGRIALTALTWSSLLVVGLLALAIGLGRRVRRRSSVV
jgi:hypothetical protein